MQRAAIITGGSHGLGLETARQFVCAGARVAILDIASPAQEDLDRVEFHCVDLGDSARVPEVFGRALESMGRIDCLVNNVGVAGPAAAVEAIGRAHV